MTCDSIVVAVDSMNIKVNIILYKNMHFDIHTY